MTLYKFEEKTLPDGSKVAQCIDDQNIALILQADLTDVQPGKKLSDLKQSSVQIVDKKGKKDKLKAAGYTQDQVDALDSLGALG